MGGGVEDGLGEANEEADSDDMAARLGGGEAEGQERPHKLAGGHPDRRADLGQDYLGGYLADDVADGPGRVDEVDLVAVHGEVLLHATDERVRDVGLVEVLDEVAERHQREEEEVQLLHELPLLLRPPRFVIPDVRPPWYLIRRVLYVEAM